MQWKEESNRLTGAVKLKNFIPVLTDLEVATQSILKVIVCLCKLDN